MAAAESKKWNDAAERDLCVAIIMGNQDENKVRYNWPNVHALMAQLGYSFTKDAISQHWTKTIMKDYKSRHANSGGGGPAPAAHAAAASGSGASTPKKAAPRKAALGVRKRAPKSKVKFAKLIDVDAEDVDDRLIDADDDDESPSKKAKVEKDDKASVKEEKLEIRDRERSATILDNETDFQHWLNTSA